MGIKFEKKRQIFHLFTKNFSYYIHINKLNYLVHLYHGKYLSDISKERVSERYAERYSFLENNKNRMDEDYYFSLLSSRFEVASHGKADKRNPYAIIEGEDGIDLTNFLYVSHKIVNGPIKEIELPHVKFKDADCKTLILNLKDEYRDIYLDLYYEVSEKYSCIVRFAKVQNKSSEDIKVKKLSSMELDFADSDYEILALKGAWGIDREVERIKVNHSHMKLGENHGARGFNYNPALAVCKNESTLDYGEVYGFVHIFSGDFAYEFKTDNLDQLRMTVGFNEETTQFLLKPNEELVTPQTIMVYSDEGLNKMSQLFHNLIRERIIIDNKYKNKERPIVLNSWEAMYFDFDTEKMKNFILEAKKLNIDLVCIDDGWFGHRNSDNSSLGDWFVNQDKINLKEVVDYAHSINMKIGIWIEPEMISPDSELFKAHPEYALYPRSKMTNPTLLRNQLVLDMCNDEAVDNVFNQLTAIFDNYPFDYVKWDFNRFLSEAYSETLPKERKLETHYRFILGTYKLLDRFTKRYPDILLETCSAGGGRFDLGMLYYSVQIWCSDETDIANRSLIQYATNIFYPLSTQGAHVSDRKLGTIQDKACLAFFGTYGYELDVLKLTNEEDKKKIIEFNNYYKQFHKAVTSGDYYAIYDPFKTNYISFNVVTKDKNLALVYFMLYRKEQTKARFIKLKGLDKDKYYFNSLTNDIYKGDFYMNVGLNISAILEAYASMLFVIKEVPAPIATIYRKTKQTDGGVRTKLI